MFSQLKEAFILAGGESLLSFFCSTSFSPSYEGWKQGACLGVEVRCVVPYMFVHVRMECAAFVCVCVGVLYTCQRLQEAVDHTARHRQTRLLWVWKQILQ